MRGSAPLPCHPPIRAAAGTPTGMASVRAGPPVGAANLWPAPAVLPAPNGAAHAIGERVPGTVQGAYAMAMGPQRKETTDIGDMALIASMMHSNVGDDAALNQHSSG